MRRFVSKLLVITFTITLLAPNLSLLDSADAQIAPSPDPSIWSQNVGIVDNGTITANEANQDPQCSNVTVGYKRYDGVLLTLPSGRKLHPVGQETTINGGERCAVSSRLGAFAPGYFAPSGNLGNAFKTNRNNISYTAAPSNEYVVISSRNSSTNRSAISISTSFTDGYIDYDSRGLLSYDLYWQPNELVNSIRYVANERPYAGQKVDASGIVFSRNGKYMVVKLAASIFARVNLQTQVMTPFYRSSVSTNGGTKYAISNDGRYVFTTNSSEIFIHDLDTCVFNYQKDLWELNQDSDLFGCTKTENLSREIQLTTTRRPRETLFPQFSLNGSEISYVDKQANENYYRVALQASGYVSGVEGYLALGDSFSSGEGDTEGGDWYEVGTDEQGSSSTFEGRNLCHLSRRSYPYLMAVELGYLATNSTSPPADGLFHSVACSGAVISNLTGGAGGVFDKNPNFSINDYSNQYSNSYLGSLNNWQPGRARQLDFLSQQLSEGYIINQSLPEAITIGIGGNDAGFGDIVRSCTLDTKTCNFAEPSSDAAVNLALTIADLKDRLVDTYTELIAASNGESRIYAIGYPNFVEVGGSCDVNVRLDVNELRMVSEGVQYMNAVIEAAAIEAGVLYVDTEEVLNGSDLCSSSDEKSFNGITYGNDKAGIEKEWINLLAVTTRGVCFLSTGCLGNESFHPNYKGQELYKDEIISITNGLETSPGAAIPQDIPLPTDFFGQEAIESVISINQGIDASQYVNKPNFFLTVGDSSDLRINQNRFYPGTGVKALLRSEPVLLGEFIADENGEIDVEVNLPDVEGGAHTVNLEGIDQYGEVVRYYQPIVIGNTDNDFDGDGVSDDTDSCPTIENSGQDIDNDGVDDSCDSEAIAPVEPPEPPNPEHPACKILRRLESRLPWYFRFIIYRLYERFDCVS